MFRAVVQSIIITVWIGGVGAEEELVLVAQSVAVEIGRGRSVVRARHVFVTVHRVQFIEIDDLILEAIGQSIAVLVCGAGNRKRASPGKLAAIAKGRVQCCDVIRAVCQPGAIERETAH